METAYVENGVSKVETSTTVGQAVIDSVLEKNGTNIGKAIIDVKQEENNGIKGDAVVVISTTDFEIEGVITLNDGILTWNEIEPNVPAIVDRVELSPATLEIEQGKSETVEVKCYNSSNNLIPTRKLRDIFITQKSGSDKITVTPDSKNRNKATISVARNQEIGNNKAIITAIVDGVEALESKRCIVNVKKVLAFGTPEYVNKYGEEVSYTSKNGYTGKWRLFYRNGTNTYIIADEITSTKYTPYSNSTGNQAKYSVVLEGDKVANPFDANTNKAKELNPTLVDEQNALFYPADNGDLQNSMKALAWECDTTVWSNYVRNGAVEGEYAVCSPSIELFVASYNATANANGKSAISCETSTYGYGYKCSRYSFLVDTEKDAETSNYYIHQLNNGIYLYNVNSETKSSWWIASPKAASTVSGIYINTGIAQFWDVGIGNNSYPVRPLICIPNTNFDIINMTTK